MQRCKDFTGELRFYTLYGPRDKDGWGNGWMEFSAYFPEGKLVALNLIEDRKPQAEQKDKP
jgi:hypothetical protein